MITHNSSLQLFSCYLSIYLSIYLLFDFGEKNIVDINIICLALTCLQYISNIYIYIYREREREREKEKEVERERKKERYMLPELL